MSSSVHYKFAVTLGTADFNTIHFDGSFIKCSELKEAIIEQKKIKLTIAELRVTNTQTSEGSLMRYSEDFCQSTLSHSLTLYTQHRLQG